MKENKKLIFDAFAHLFLLMAENETDNVELTFDFNKVNARFKVEVISLENKRKDKIKKQEPCVGIVQHEEVTLLKQDYDAMVEREETLKKKLAEEHAETLKYEKKYENEIEQLKQQLADKDHEIENYQHELEVYKHNDNIYSSNIIKMNNNAKRNKIDFAVAELKKVKKWANERYNGWKTSKNANEFVIKGICLALENIGYEINNQIKQLKEKKL